MGQYPLGIRSMLRTANLKQIGNIHNGMGKINFVFNLVKNIFILL